MNRWYKVSKQERKEAGISCFMSVFPIKKNDLQTGKHAERLVWEEWNQKGSGEIASEHPAPGNESNYLRHDGFQCGMGTGTLEPFATIGHHLADVRGE